MKLIKKNYLIHISFSVLKVLLMTVSSIYFFKMRSSKYFLEELQVNCILGGGKDWRKMITLVFFFILEKIFLLPFPISKILIMMANSKYLSIVKIIFYISLKSPAN